MEACPFVTDTAPQRTLGAVMSWWTIGLFVLVFLGYALLFYVGVP